MDLNLLSLSIGLGLAVSLIFSELFGLAAGGLVVPGYLALYLNQPLDVVLTLAAATVTFVVVRLASSFVIIYGKRRTVLMILVGYAVGMGINNLIGGGIEVGVETPLGAIPPGVGAVQTPLAALSGPAVVELRTIGFIIPGLIAIWMDRQGAMATLAALLTSAVVVRLLLVLLVPSDLLWFEAEAASPLRVWMEELE